MNQFGPIENTLRATPQRPLLGLTVLVVDDSLFSSDTLRRSCLLSGARLRRADCLAAARRHLSVYRPSVLIVELDLPDGCGLDLLREAAAAEPRIDVLLATSDDPTREAEARAAGADGLIAAPVASAATVQSTIIAALPAERRLPGPRLVPDADVSGDPIAFSEDMNRAQELLRHADGPDHVWRAGRFAARVARCAGEPILARAGDTLSDAVRGGQDVPKARQRLARLIEVHLEARRSGALAL